MTYLLPYLIRQIAYWFCWLKCAGRCAASIVKPQSILGYGWFHSSSGQPQEAGGIATQHQLQLLG